MTLPTDVAEADEALVVDGAPAIWQHYPAIRAHLLSQDAEIERLSQESAQQFIRARDWAELSGKNEDRASLAESRLAAANALLREVYDHGENMALHEKIDAHLSENADVQP